MPCGGKVAGSTAFGYVAVPRLYYALASLDARLTYLRSTLTGITGSIDGVAGRPQRTVRFLNPSATQFNFPAGIKLGPSDTPMP